MLWINTQSQKIDFKHPELKVVYAIFEDIEKMNPAIIQLGQSHTDSINKATNLYSNTKDLQKILVNERIQQYELVEKMT